MSATSQGRNIMVQGRIVWVAGDLFKGKGKTDEQTRQPIIDQRTGQQKIEYGFGLAVPKSAVGEIWTAMHEEAQALYQGRQIPPNFAFKFKDGDGVDHNGVAFAQREGHAGCLIFACTTSIPIKYFKFDEATKQNFQINEGIKCGDYVNVQLSVKAHPPLGQGKPGLYLNPNAVQFLGFGKEIINTPSGDQLFGTQAPALPPGASATPVAQAGFIVPPAQSQYGQTPGMPQQFAPPPAQAEPHYGVLPSIHQPQNQMAPPMPQVPGAQQLGNFQQGPQVAPFAANMPTGLPPMGYAPVAAGYNQQPPAPQHFAPPMPNPGAGGNMSGFPIPGGMPQYRR